MTLTLVRVLVLSCLVAVASGATQDGQPLDVLAAMKRKREVSCLQSYKIAFDKTTHGAAYAAGGKSTSCRESVDFHIEWPSGRFRLDGKTDCDNPHESFESYDGEQTRTKFRLFDGLGKPTNEWKYGLLTGVQRTRIFTSDYWPVFFAKGVIKSSTLQSFYPGSFYLDAPADRFYLHRKGVALSRFVLRTFPDSQREPTTYEYVIDPSKDYSVVEFSQLNGSGKVISISIEVKSWGGKWAPVGWRYTRTTRGQVSQTVIATVTDYSETSETPSGFFDLIAPDGAKVGRSDFQFSKDGKDIQRQGYEYQVQDGVLIQTHGPSGASNTWGTRNLYWLAIVILSVFAFAFCKRRRNRTVII